MSNPGSTDPSRPRHSGQPGYNGQAGPTRIPHPAPAAPSPPQMMSGEREQQVINLGDTGRSGGMIKCLACGSTDIRYTVEARALVCANCRTKFSETRLEDEVDLTGGIQDLTGTTVTASAQQLTDDQIVTVKCRGCGAEVVINAQEGPQARCHWCRNYLAQDAHIRNGAVPDAVAPFLIPRAQAISTIKSFVHARQFYAHPQFRREFAPENVVGVYLPYFVFDGHASARLTGQGEIKTRQWTEKEGDSQTTYYSADVYQVGRNFTISVDDLLLESSAERANYSDPSQTNNIINAILPFNVKEAVRYNPNYLRGFTSERRDVNVDQMHHTVRDRLLTISRNKSESMVQQYGRGVRWDSEDINLHGSRWVSMYLPVWLYSYYQADKGIKHFVAVNGQNGQVMGSVPLNLPVLILMTLLVFVIGSFIGLFLFLATL